MRVGEDVGDAARGAGEGVSTASKGLGEGIATTAEGIGSGIGTIFSSATSIFFIIFGVICCIMIVAVIAIAYMTTNETFGENLGKAASAAKDVSEVLPQGKAMKIANQLTGGLFY